MLQNLAMMAAGAFLVCLGVCAGAWADRIRGYRAGSVLPVARARIGKREPAEVVAAATAVPVPAGRSETIATPASPPVLTGKGAEVVEALTQMGFKRQHAELAARGVPSSLQGSIESWTRAALRAGTVAS